MLLIPKCHGQTDRQTDRRLTVALPHSALASRDKKNIQYAIRVLTNYAVSRNGSFHDVEALPAESLDTYLSGFYAELRKKDGSFYSKNATVTIRCGLQKHFMKPPNLRSLMTPDSTQQIRCLLQFWLSWRGKAKAVFSTSSLSPAKTSTSCIHNRLLQLITQKGFKTKFLSILQFISATAVVKICVK